jgi:hypothetical protein
MSVSRSVEEVAPSYPAFSDEVDGPSKAGGGALISAVADAGMDDFLGSAGSSPLDKDDEKTSLTDKTSRSPIAGARASSLLRRRSLDDGGPIEVVTTAATMPMMDFSAEAEQFKLDIAPPGGFIRAESLDTGLQRKKKVDEKRKSMRIQDPLLGGILSTHQPTLEVLHMELVAKHGKSKKKKSHTSSDSEEDTEPGAVRTVIVPPREVLNRMPIYTTPLTLESTHHAFRDFVARLLGMGFELAQAECAVVITSAENVERAVEFIFQHPDGLWHRFRPDADTKEAMRDRNEDRGTTEFEEIFERADICDVCGLQYWRHYVDPNGQKIEVVEDHSDDALHGDLMGRVSMSVATRATREELLDEIRQAEENRMAVITMLDTIQDEGLAVQHDMGSDMIRSAASLAATQPALPPGYDGPTETCMVCFDEKPTDKFLIASCGHNYCHECLKEHYKVKTKDGDVLKIGCIDPSCDREILEEEVLECLRGDAALLSKFRKFRRDRLLMMDPSTRFCVTPDCDGVMTGTRFRPKMECPDCHVHVCFNCNQGWHGYFVSCNSTIDVGVAMWSIGKDVQKCPRCKVKIEKSDGCNHMTCMSCKYEFCWICRGPYSGDHFAAFNIFGCPGGQFTPAFLRFPACFPRWLNRLFILVCAMAVIAPFAAVFGVLWIIGVCFLMCIKCGDMSVDDCNPCDC